MLLPLSSISTKHFFQSWCRIHPCGARHRRAIIIPHLSLEPNILTVTKVLNCSCRHSLCRLIYVSLVFFDSIAPTYPVSFPPPTFEKLLCDIMSGLVIHLLEIPLWNWRSLFRFLKWFYYFPRVHPLQP